MARRPEAPSRRAFALGLPLLPLLARQAGTPGLEAGARKPLAATAILLRHAEKSAEGDPKDPSLSEAGAKRAKALAALLSRARVSHLFASEFKRTQETLAPLAEAAKVAVTVVPGAKAADLAQQILALEAGAVAVVAGHSNTVPALAALLGGTLQGLETTPQGPMLPDAEYGRIFVLTPAAEVLGKASVLELAY